ncbi:MAG: hypothetical protein WBP03_05430 [Candidatus Saccharimonadales bacterium]
MQKSPEGSVRSLEARLRSVRRAIVNYFNESHRQALLDDRLAAGVHPDGTPVISGERVAMGLAPYDLAELRSKVGSQRLIQ